MSSKGGNKKREVPFVLEEVPLKTQQGAKLEIKNNDQTNEKNQ